MTDAGAGHNISVAAIVVMNALFLIGLTYKVMTKRFWVTWDSAAIGGVYVLAVVLSYVLRAYCPDGRQLVVVGGEALGLRMSPRRHPRPCVSFEIAGLAPHVIPRWRRILVLDEPREPAVNHVEIRGAETIIGVRDATVVGTDGTVKVAV